jgi:hypothetical protein
LADDIVQVAERPVAGQILDADVDEIRRRRDASSISGIAYPAGRPRGSL